MPFKLTDTAIRAAKPKEKHYKLTDGQGLYVEVAPTGGKWWRIKYRFGGKEKRLSLGVYPAVGLKEARSRTAEIKDMLLRGLDPGEERKAAKAEAEAVKKAEAATFENVAAEWLGLKKEEWAATNFKKKTRLVQRLCAGFGDKRITDVTPTDILSVVRPFDASGHTVTAHALAQTAGQICRYARTCGLCTFNPADGLTREALKPIRSEHRAAITNPAELGRLLVNIDAYKGYVSVTYALKLLAYLPLRSQELRGGMWEELDLEKALWTIPATRRERPQDGGGMKCRIAFELPLPRQAVQLFRELREYQVPGPLCFPGRSSATKCISDMSLLSAVRSMGYGKEEMCVHGFRSVFSSLCNEKKLQWGFDSDVIEACLSHKEGDAVRAAYNRTTYLEQRRALLQRWADYVDSLRAAAE